MDKLEIEQMQQLAYAIQMFVGWIGGAALLGIILMLIVGLFAK